MIPVVIVVALVAGLFRTHLAAVPVVVVLWVGLLLIAGDSTVSRLELGIGGGLLALFNAVPGYGLGRGIRTMVETVKQDVGDHLEARDSKLKTEGSETE